MLTDVAVGIGSVTTGNWPIRPYKRRNLIERMFGKLKDWRRIATRYDRYAHTFMGAISIAATVIVRL